jgi:hypothetical protein
MRHTLIALAALMACTVASMAQEGTPTGPPPVIAIGREEIPPGRMPAHERNAAGFVSMLNRSGAATHRIALVPVSGDDNQVLYLEPYGSFAEFEQARQQFDQAVASNVALRAEMEQLQRDNAQLHNSQRTTLARYRADLSYRPRSPEETARSRYFSITTVRLKPGRGADYMEYLKQGNAGRAKANIDDHNAVYQVASGAPFGTFLIFSSLKSLKEWDDGFARTQQDQKALEEALGGPVVTASRRQLLAEIAAEAVNTLFAINPAMSRPTAQMAALDPGFWTPKPVVPSGKALAVKKVATKNQPKP